MSIQKDKVYSVNEVVKSGLIPKWRNNITAVKACYEDLVKPKKDRLLDAEIRGEGTKKRIYIKGANLAKYAAAQD